MKNFTLGCINGNKINETMRCQYCGCEMKQGVEYIGENTSISYWCKNCNSGAVFFNHRSRKLLGIELNFKYE